jgi:acetylornithine deacetylase/succinyl-diaminopimelate desuccinylase-like protein
LSAILHYGLITVLINADEEVSSPGSRAILTKLGAEHDAVFSCEGTLLSSDRLSLTTAGIGAILLNIMGRASHAGQAPDWDATRSWNSHTKCYRAVACRIRLSA